MPVQNPDIAEIFEKMANLLEFQDANPFRVRAYRNAARTVSGMGRNVADMVKNDEDLTELDGIGKDLAGKIRQIVDTGTLDELASLEKAVPRKLDQLLRLEGVGPKKIAVLYNQLGIETPAQLKKAAQQQKIRGLKGFGAKTEDNILKEIKRLESRKEERMPRMEAEQRLQPLMAYLKGARGVKKIEVAGSYRRCRETVGDLDILAACRKDNALMDRLVDFEDVVRVISHGKTRSSVVLRGELHVDLRVVSEAAFGAAMHYFTGSKAHNIAIRKIGVQKKLKINEYGVFKGDTRIAGKTEEEVFGAVDLPYIPPELRENKGEIEAARQGRLPRLITVEAIRGDLHCHTNETDGHATLEEMAEAAKDRGYDYLAITDHSRNVSMAKGMDAKRLARQIEAVDRLNEKLKGIRVLKGCEVDILKDGSLDLPDDILKQLDLVVCSVHYHRNLSKDKQTQRILRAMDNPNFNILAHPSGRLINSRDPYEIDLEHIMKEAKERGCVLELNAHPERLDISDAQCRMAREIGVRLAISTDAHHVSDLRHIRWGVDQARRGWVEADMVINTLSLKKLLTLLKR